MSSRPVSGIQHRHRVPVTSPQPPDRVRARPVLHLEGPAALPPSCDRQDRSAPTRRADTFVAAPRDPNRASKLFFPSDVLTTMVSPSGVFEIVRVVSCDLVSIAEVHAIIAGAHHAQSEPEMARDRFGLLERHGFVKSSSGSVSKAAHELHAMPVARPGRVAALEPPATVGVSLAVEAACQLVALDLRERHHTCLASRISMASTYSSLRQRLALRSARARLPAHSARLKAITPLGQNLLGGCAAKWITTQWLETRLTRARLCGLAVVASASNLMRMRLP